MRKLLVGLLFLFCVTNLYAGDINKIVFFGDSLTDDGNLYNLSYGIIPKSPPYFKGRFSNGPTWAEEVGKYYYQKNYVGYANYAVGGATAAFRFPTSRFIAPTFLGAEVEKYVIASTFEDRSKMLFSILIGGNDYFFYSDKYDAQTITNQVVGAIKDSILELINQGGKNFIVFNLPDLAAAPYADEMGHKAKWHELTLLHNEKLKLAIDEIYLNHPNIKIIYMNMYALFEDVIKHVDKYNKKYGSNIHNLTEACWKGRYLEKTLSSHELRQALLRHAPEAQSFTDKNIDAIENLILNSPALMHAYKMSDADMNAGNLCPNPNEYIFWDTIHPTAAVHFISAKMVIDVLTSEMPQISH